MEHESKLENVQSVIPLLRRLAMHGDGPLRVVALEGSEREALADLVLWLSSIPQNGDSNPSTSGTVEDKSMFDDYLISFNTPLRKQARGTAMGMSKLAPVSNNWLTCLRAVRVLRIAKAWRKKAAASSRLKHEENINLARELSRLHNWDDYDCFQVVKASNGRPLEVTASALFQRLDLPGKLQLPLTKLRKFLSEIEKMYARHVPYHSSTHASDVVQGIACFLCAEEELSSKFTDLEVMSLILAAVIHDCGHPGVNNAFLVTTNSDSAYCYNDMSVNENMHLSVAFKVLAEPGNDFLCNLSQADFRFVRRMVIDTVLSTDMAFHTGLLKSFAATVGLHGTDLSSWEGENRTLLFKYVLHAFDISNPGRPWKHCLAWAERITLENFAQGDREAEIGIPVSSLNDRTKANVVKSQQVFCDLFVKPTFQGLAGIAPTVCGLVLNNCNVNSNFYQKLLDAGQSQLPQECACSLDTLCGCEGSIGGYI
eukprot:gene16384-22586_t